MLKCDFANLTREINLLEQAGTRLIHWDVMDGNFVPNLSYGAMVIHRTRPLTDIPFEAHLMISRPEQFLDDYLKAGCDLITFHLEAVSDPRPLFDHIHAAGALAGLAINPKTPVDAAFPYLDLCDLLLVMSVEPGFGGQKFIPAALPKLRALRDRPNLRPLLAIDGGIGPSTITDAAQAGAEVFVVGSALFDHSDYARGIDSLAMAAGKGAASSHA